MLGKWVDIAVPRCDFLPVKLIVKVLAYFIIVITSFALLVFIYIYIFIFVVEV